MSKYFLHSLAVSFVAGALVYKSWLLGLCSVAILALITGKEAYADYLASKQNNETVKTLKQIAEDQAKWERKFEQWQTELGKVSYRVNQMGDYVGSPRD
jgi:uncharacterized protein YcfJ